MPPLNLSDWQGCELFSRDTVVRKRDITHWRQTMVHPVMFTLAGLAGAVLWLSLLVASGFSRAAVGVGLLGMLFLIDGRPRTRP
jgi:hypothetical protein